MYCKKCGCEIKADSKFCFQCGNTLEAAPVPIVAPPVEPSALNDLFFDSTEKEIAFLGNSFLRSRISSGKMKKNSCVLSDKRIYFKGKCYNRSSGHFMKSTEESTVDVKDITASGFSSGSRIIFLFLAVIFLIASLCVLVVDMFVRIEGMMLYGISFIPFSLVMFGLYVCTKIKLFYIAFAGGKIEFNVSKHTRNELREFNKALRLTIDASEKNKSI